MSLINRLRPIVASPGFRQAELCVIFILLALLFVRRIDYVQFFKDESDWIADSRYFDALLAGDTSADTWADQGVLLDQPPLPRYIIGLGRRLAGYQVEDLNLRWRSQADYQTGVAEGRVPSTGLLWWSRLPMAVLAAVSGVLIFWWVNQISRRLAGYLWLLQYVASYYITAALCKAMAESPLLITVSFAGVYGLFALHESRRVASTVPVSLFSFRYLFVWFLLLGLCSGLAALAKLNGVAVLGAGLLLVAWIVLNDSGGLSKLHRGLLALIAGGLPVVSAYAVFVFLNPYLYPDPVGRSLLMYTDRVQSMTGQQQRYAEDSIDGISDRLQVVPTMILQELAVVRFPGSLWLNLGLMGFGVAVTVGRAFRRGAAPQSLASVTLLSLFVTVCIPPLFTPLNWPRYYILPVVFSMIFAALGLARLLELAYAYVQRRIAARKLAQPYSTP